MFAQQEHAAKVQQAEERARKRAEKRAGHGGVRASLDFGADAVLGAPRALRRRGSGPPLPSRMAGA